MIIISGILATKEAITGFPAPIPSASNPTHHFVQSGMDQNVPYSTRLGISDRQPVKFFSNPDLYTLFSRAVRRGPSPINKKRLSGNSYRLPLFSSFNQIGMPLYRNWATYCTYNLVLLSDIKAIPHLLWGYTRISGTIQVDASMDNSYLSPGCYLKIHIIPCFHFS